MSKNQTRHKRAYAYGAHQGMRELRQVLAGLMPNEAVIELDKIIENLKRERFPMPPVGGQ